MNNVDARSLDEVYLSWLYGLIGSTQNRNPATSHWSLLQELYTKQFDGYVPNDDNRAADGKDLRIEFLQTSGYYLDDPYGQWFDVDCSILEMTIALSRRVAFEDESLKSPVDWFWRMIRNLELDKYTDDSWSTSVQREVNFTLDRLNTRQYGANGVGGLFPLKAPYHDQRTVELWTQMSAYLLEGAYLEAQPRW